MAAKKRRKKASKKASKTAGAKPVVYNKKTRAKKTKHKMPSHASMALGHIIRQLEHVREGIDQVQPE